MNSFAAGRTTAGIPRTGWGYSSGTSLGGGSLFGRLAGKSAAGALRRPAPEIYDATGKLR